MSKQSDEIAALRKKVEELEAKVDPPKSTFVPMSDAEWIDKMHQMRERRMAHTMHPEAEANKHQLALDRWVESQRAFEDELNDQYFVGGFQEFHSKTPSFHKSRRDRDWRVR